MSITSIPDFSNSSSIRSSISSISSNNSNKIRNLNNVSLANGNNFNKLHIIIEAKKNNNNNSNESLPNPNNGSNNNSTKVCIRGTHHSVFKGTKTHIGTANKSNIAKKKDVLKYYDIIKGKSRKLEFKKIGRTNNSYEVIKREACNLKSQEMFDELNEKFKGERVFNSDLITGIQLRIFGLKAYSKSLLGRPVRCRCIDISKSHNTTIIREVLYGFIFHEHVRLIGGVEYHYVMVAFYKDNRIIISDFIQYYESKLLSSKSSKIKYYIFDDFNKLESIKSEERQEALIQFEEAHKKATSINTDIIQQFQSVEEHKHPGGDFVLILRNSIQFKSLESLKKMIQDKMMQDLISKTKSNDKYVSFSLNTITMHSDKQIKYKKQLLDDLIELYPNKNLQSLLDTLYNPKKGGKQTKKTRRSKKN